MRSLIFWALMALTLSSAAFARGTMPARGGPAMQMGRGNGDVVGAAHDTRHPIELGAAARAEMLANMRRMLASVNGVIEGLARGRMKTVADAAASSGTSMMRDLPASIRSQLPMPFTQMGMASHRAFDQIAAEARGGKRPRVIMTLLSQSLRGCSACHATYRFASRP